MMLRLWLFLDNGGLGMLLQSFNARTCPSTMADTSVPRVSHRSPCLHHKPPLSLAPPCQYALHPKRTRRKSLVRSDASTSSPGRAGTHHRLPSPFARKTCRAARPRSGTGVSTWTDLHRWNMHPRDGAGGGVSCLSVLGTSGATSSSPAPTPTCAFCFLLRLHITRVRTLTLVDGEGKAPAQTSLRVVSVRDPPLKVLGTPSSLRRVPRTPRSQQHLHAPLPSARLVWRAATRTTRTQRGLSSLTYHHPPFPSILRPRPSPPVPYSPPPTPPLHSPARPLGPAAPQAPTPDPPARTWAPPRRPILIRSRSPRETHAYTTPTTHPAPRSG
ncbi:hypothetical protein BC628DRAFT_144333 [Trametes gibbosa]|nr:hypothetical protein BC628DRAFT_144333 [Trametes gibbosa]